MAKTRLKKITIKSFRALKDVEVSFGTDITVLCGKNGTAKSSILGIAAQIFSFDRDYTSDKRLSFKTIMDESFKSQFSDHFRVSPKFDVTGSMDVGIQVYDAYTSSNATGELTITTRHSSSGKTPRAVFRNNSTAEEGANKDRNFTHPVIFLSLKRLYPIANREKYLEKTFPYFDLPDNRKAFVNLTNELLAKQVNNLTGTIGTVTSAVSHGDNYDCHSVSSGEDNVGQIIVALLSFRKLKEEYGDDYKGGMLLIDEADAGLFPAAQKKLIDILDRECRDLKLQVIMTSHSTTLIEKIHEEGLKPHNRSRFKTVYLTDTFGSIAIRDDWDWPRIYSDINIQPIAVKGIKAPKVNVYFEDKEGLDFFNTLMFRNPVKRLLNIFCDVSLGCSNYIQLIKHGRVPEFRDHSIVCLDADAKAQSKGLKSIVILPAHLPPDQLIFEFLYNKPPSDPIWKNSIGYTRPVFLNDGSDVTRELSITGSSLDLVAELKMYTGSRKPRELFKAFYKKNNFQNFLKEKKKFNPWKQWVEENPNEREKFSSSFVARLKHILKNVYGMNEGELTVLK
ncbi:AAA family ATPase [Coraliomargarita algicola]|uniref:AAA family ATPase n=1 Tax=Coraliomargarita algicola TaxID=3092156 RepID=A0ABZ0RGE3_9BACT|nr:AAA family ATPase [Coraliomargarita sp. J2-16]WPJ95234.1 AAA family ATPase [Coraliomargarita sp. J2-16]